MKVKLIKFNENAVIPFKKHKSDFCYDCVATSCEEIAPNVYKYGLGFGLQIERDNEVILSTINEYAGELKTVIDFSYSPCLLDIDFVPRSSIWETGMVLSNSKGTVDEHYTGEIFVIFYHVLPNMPKYEVGNKIIQCNIGMNFPIDFIEVSELNKTERGTGGHGSTGK